MTATKKKTCDTCGKSKANRSFRLVGKGPPAAYAKTCLLCESKQGEIPEDPKEFANQKVKRDRAAENEAKIREELARRELARRKLIYYVKRYERNYRDGWIHRMIAAELEKFLQDVVDGKSPRLMIFVPPRHGKSLLASDYFISWAMGREPWLQIISSSYSASLPKKFSRRIRARLTSKKHQALFPEAQLAPDSRNIEHWSTTKEGEYITAGVGGGITGHGAHILMIDDPVKDQEEADSETIRDTHWDWWSSTASTRVEPGGGVLVIQTRWHDDDLSGRMIRQMNETIEEEGEGALVEEEFDRWRILSFPAIAEDNEYMINNEVYTGSIDHLALEEQEQAKQLRTKGEALHEERWPLASLRRKKRGMQPRHWSALYQQNPVPDEGITFTKDMFVTRPLRMQYDDCILLAAWDLAIGKNSHHDWTVGGVGALDQYGCLTLLDVVRGRWGTFGIVEAILDMYQRYPQIRRIGIERGQLELALDEPLKARMEERRLFPTLDRTLVPIHDKEKRAAPLQGLMQAHKILLPDNVSCPAVDRIKDELLRFPAGIHEDSVDMLAWLARMAMKTQPPKPQNPQQHRSWKEDLYKYTDKYSDTSDPMAA